MQTKILCVSLITLIASLFSACSSSTNLFGTSDSPELFPVRQNGKIGYINKTGEVVIQPQFQIAFFFSEGLAVACLERGDKCGYIDVTGKFIINPQFRFAERFSEGLAAVEVEDKVGYIDKTGKFAINPQFERAGDSLLRPFSEGLASVKIGDKIGFVDAEGKIVINPQFDQASPFFDGLAAARMGDKWGFIDKEGKIVVNPQFEEAARFSEGLAAVRIGQQYGYVDNSGKIVINPQFNTALPFSAEGLALVTLNQKVGFIDKNGKYVINPQFAAAGDLVGSYMREAHLITYDLGRFSFSEGLTPVKIGDNPSGKFGYSDATGKIVINPQFDIALPFYGGLAFVMVQDAMAYIDKSGNYIWRETKNSPTANTATNANRSNSNANANASAMNTATVTNTSSAQRTGRLTTDSNIRSDPNKDAGSLGIHFKGAKVRILDETTYTRDDGEQTTWFRIAVYETGCSVTANLGCGKNSPGDADEGWVNARNVLID